MSRNDSPTGQQFHFRYDPQNGDGPYWSNVYDTREDLDRELKIHRDWGYECTPYVRDVSPWREDGSTAL